VAGLRLRGDRTDLHVTESETAERVDPDTVLVETGSQTECVREGQSHGFHRRTRERDPSQHRLGGTDRGERLVVRLLGVGTDQELIEDHAVRGRPRTHRVAHSCSDLTPMSPARIAAMPCTAAAAPWTVVMHGVPVRTAAARISYPSMRASEAEPFGVFTIRSISP